jgi:hypothetical protein
MWPNNGFPSNGDFPQNNFNQQDEYPHSPFGAGAAGYFPQQLPFSPNGGLMINDFQPEVGLYNEGAFAQNHFANVANSQVSF